MSVETKPTSKGKKRKSRVKASDESNDNNNTNIPDTDAKNGTSSVVKLIRNPSKPRQYADYTRWLMKNEPPYSLYNLAKSHTKIEPWVGVRSGEACNIMKYDMKIGQKVLYYEANITNPHISGIAEICSDPYPDATAFDKSHKYYDSNNNDINNPKWYLVDVKFVRLFDRPVYLQELKYYPELSDLIMLKKFRLSITPINEQHWDFIMKLEKSQIHTDIKNKLKKEKKPKNEVDNNDDKEPNQDNNDHHQSMKDNEDNSEVNDNNNNTEEKPSKGKKSKKSKS